MADKIKLGILFRGTSIESDISLMSCENVIKYINKDKYDTTLYNVDGSREWIKKLIEDNPDIVFSTLHGGRGENGSMQGLLHYLNIPFVGSKVLASSLCMDKKIAKTVMSHNHIPVAQDIYIKRGDSIEAYREQAEVLAYPLIAKPNRGGSSIGIEICNSFEEVKKACENIVSTYDDDILLEKYIEGREIGCCVIGDRVCLLDVATTKGIFGYDDKYKRPSTSQPKDMPKYQEDMIKAVALKTFNVLKCKGYALIDIIVKQEQIYVLEVNTLPGLTATSLMPKAAEILGIGFGEFIDTLIEAELNRED